MGSGKDREGAELCGKRLLLWVGEALVHVTLHTMTRVSLIHRGSCLWEHQGGRGTQCCFGTKMHRTYSKAFKDNVRKRHFHVKAIMRSYMS